MLDVTKRHSTAPFDTARLDRLMDEAGIDVLRRDVQAQCPISAGRSSRVLLRIHGCDGLEPLSAGVRLCQGRAAKGRLFRPSHGEFPERGEAVLGVGNQHQELRLGRRHGKGRRLCAPARRRSRSASGSRLAFLPADSAAVLRKAFPDSEIKDALFVLERLRALQDSGGTGKAAHRVRCS